jgi:hypothetical protein
MAKDEFKVSLALTRTIESTTTLVAYAALGLITRESTALVPYLAPGVILGLPLGFWLIRRIQPETFRRVCMSFDAWLVGFGLSRIVARLDLAPIAMAYQLLVLTIIIDAILLRAFFKSRSQSVDVPPAELSTA